MESQPLGAYVHGVAAPRCVGLQPLALGAAALGAWLWSGPVQPHQSAVRLESIEVGASSSRSPAAKAALLLGMQRQRGPHRRSVASVAGASSRHDRAAGSAGCEASAWAISAAARVGVVSRSVGTESRSSAYVSGTWCVVSGER